MVLVIDIGNTNIKNGLFDGQELAYSWRMSKDANKTADEYGILYSAFFQHIKVPIEDVTGIIISSVVPNIDYTIEHLCHLYFSNVSPIFVGPGIKTGIRLLYNNPRELGADRICNAVAAHELYGGPCITVDFGTASTFGALTGEGDFLGGAICPGVKISLDALVRNTERLTVVELETPPSIMGKNTIQCIQSGIIYGHAAQVDGIIERMIAEMGGEMPTLIATGGMASLLVPHSRYLKHIDSTLTLQGLRLLYERNIDV